MSGCKPEFYEIDGLKVPPFFSKECFESALQFRPQSGDISIATYPKCGTTWMQFVVVNILRRAKTLENPRDFFLASPFLDQLGAEDSQKMMIRPGAYKTHLPFEKVPWSDEAKYIYVARNPKDCSVSFYHHMRQLPGYQFSEGTFDEFFDMFMAGDLEYSDYFDHLLLWYCERNRPNVFFTTFEEMKTDLESVVLKVAEFVNEDEAKYLEDNRPVLDAILRNCSFKEMKFINEALSRMYHNIADVLADPTIPKGRKHIAAYNYNLPQHKKTWIEFIRKGEIGEWKTVFTPEQNEKMEERIREVSKCSDVMTLWSSVR